MATTKRSTSGRSSRATRSARSKAETMAIGLPPKRTPAIRGRVGKANEPYVINERRR
jgi:hypothetical protein